MMQEGTWIIVVYDYVSDKNVVAKICEILNMIIPILES